MVKINGNKMKGIFPDIIVTDTKTFDKHDEVVMECYVEVRPDIYVQAKKAKLVKESFWEKLPTKQEVIQDFIDGMTLFIKNYVPMKKFAQFEFTREQVEKILNANQSQ